MGGDPHRSFYLFYYWYAIADRYAIFLYGHIASAGIPSAQPFDEMTSSRYWMAGLVASGAFLRRATKQDRPVYYDLGVFQMS